MSLQQGVQSKHSANGFIRRRDIGTRVENKFPSGKSYPQKLKITGYEPPSRDRLVYITTCLIGHHVEVQVKNGSIYTGIFHATNAEKDFGIILKMARLTKEAPLRGQKALAEAISKGPSRTLIIPAKELVQVIAKDVPVTKDVLLSEVQHEKQQELMLDYSISQSRHVDGERELEPWAPDEDDLHCPELEHTFDVSWNRSWDQFETNEMLFGVKSTFNEELYTTKLDRGPQMRELEREALRIAREIEGEETQDLHLAEERGHLLHDEIDIDEETKFSSVNRGKVDDRQYEEIEDTLFDSQINDIFRGSLDSVNKTSTDLTPGKISNDAQVSSSSSTLDQAQPSQSSICVDLSRSSSNDHASHLASEPPCQSESRIQETLLAEQHEGNNNAKEPVEKERATDDSQRAKAKNSQSSLDWKKDDSDREGLSPKATSHAPSRASLKGNEKLSSSGELLEGPLSGKAHAEKQTGNDVGRPGSSASSNSDRAAAPAASVCPGLSPSSSVGSLSSEKSTLNPHAKEFKFNPNAKSFVPHQTPVRPQSPVSDSSFYYPNMSAVPHMHGVPFGVGVAPAFAGHQPVVFNPPVAPVQPSQSYYQPNGPQYGQQMLLGHPRQVVYMPGYPPELPYKGREY